MLLLVSLLWIWWNIVCSVSRCVCVCVSMCVCVCVWDYPTKGEWNIEQNMAMFLKCNEVAVIIHSGRGCELPQTAADWRRLQQLRALTSSVRNRSDVRWHHMLCVLAMLSFNEVHPQYLEVRCVDQQRCWCRVGVSYCVDVRSCCLSLYLIS